MASFLERFLSINILDYILETIHKLTATYIDGLEDIVGNSKYAIFFPTCGPRSLADEMANSDFDGDMYWVSRNPLVGNCFSNI